jgi:hypothetical protein
VQPPAARTFRAQLVCDPRGSPITKVSGVCITATGIAYSLPDLRPRCRSTAQSGKHRCPARPMASGDVSLTSRDGAFAVSPPGLGRGTCSPDQHAAFHAHPIGHVPTRSGMRHASFLRQTA